jgi:hypothetical protein
MSRAAVAATIALAATATLAAQQTRPTRDAGTTVTSGTASISGMVVDDDEAKPAPVRRAIITLIGDGLRPSRGAITDDEGRFTILDLPAGRFTLTVSKASYITSAFGAKRPGRPGTPVSIAAGAHVRDLVVKIWRGAVIAGVVRDEHGTPVPGVPVTATPMRAGGAQLLTLSNNGDETNDLGEYRIFGLEPGRFVVSVKPSSGGGGPLTAMPDNEVDAAFALLKRRAATTGALSAAADLPAPRPFEYAPVFHPSETILAHAQPVAVVAGQEALGTDIALRRVMTSTVSGHLSRVDGMPAAGTSLQLKMVVPPGPFALDAPTVNATARSDGTFYFPQVLPGAYRLIARAAARPAPPTDPRGGSVRPPSGMESLWAVADVSAAGADIQGLALTLEPGVTVSGRIAVDGTTEPPQDLSQFRVFMAIPQLLTLRPGQGLSSSQFLQMPSPVQVRPDGTFEIAGLLPDTFKLNIVGPGIGPTGWRPATALAGGTDWLDGLVTLAPRTTVSNLVLTLTDRHSELTGTLESSDGQPVSDVFVIAFSSTRAHWGLGSRRVQAVRPAIDGQYAIADLPPGEYFLSALSDVDQDEWLDPAFLETLVPSSLRITIGDGEKKVQNLRLGAAR